MDLLEECRKVFDIEISQLQMVRESLDEGIVNVIHLIHGCKGKVVITGIGKAGHVCQKLAATFSSLGIASFFMHPVEALHGDLGSLNQDDILLLISNSGNTKELLNLFPSLRLIGITTIAITSNPESDLAAYSNFALCTPKIHEACSLNLAPTSSTTVEMVIGDALAVSVSKLNQFDKERFAVYHPAGTLGHKLLMRVSDIMFTGCDVPIVSSNTLVKDAVVIISQKNCGAVIIIDSECSMRGILTDGDIRRSFEKNIDIYSVTIDKIMTANPIFTHKNMLAVDALKLMERRMISVLPVIDDLKKPIGIIRNHDIFLKGIMP